MPPVPLVSSRQLSAFGKIVRVARTSQKLTADSYFVGQGKKGVK
jgi:hypothetical protein